MSKLGNIDRIVVVDEGQHSKIIADGPSPDIRKDPARPGFACGRVTHEVRSSGPVDATFAGGWPFSARSIARRSSPRATGLVT